MKQKQINQNWKEFELGEIIECLDNQRIPITGSDRKKGEIPYYGANGQQDSVADSIFNEELLLLAEDGGSWGYKQKCSYIINGKSWVNNHAHVLRMKKDMININLLRYWFNLTDLNKYISGTTRGKLNQGVMKKIKIPLPVLSDGTSDLEKQKQIVAMLEKAEGLKDKRKGLDELFDEYLKSVFYEMFGDPFNNPKGFNTKRLVKDVVLINGRAFKTSEWSNEGIKIIRIQNLNKPSAGYNRYNGEVDEKNIVEKGDMLLSWSGTPGTSFGVFIWEKEKAALNQHIFKVELPSDLEKTFFQYFINSKLLELISKSHGGVGLQHITKSELNNVDVYYPPITLQEKFASIVEQVEKIKDKLKDEKKDADELFNALMQKAFSGELA
ncbi:hypothetical protein HN630_04655 [archaeon]|jgi:type I restriction enzyme, S subunit|nr:hypothetical protein [archaeon]MBT7239249.1 hypothetical protein [archaeon]MBT7568170.1 hypothetical protein [archaeon]